MRYVEKRISRESSCSYIVVIRNSNLNLR